MSRGCAPYLVFGIVACARAFAAEADTLQQPTLEQSASTSTAGANQPLGLRLAQKGQYTEIGLSHARETLSTDPRGWTDTQVDLMHYFEPRKVLIGRATSSERFGLHDDTLAVGAYHPLGERTTAFAEISASDTHRVLPRSSAQLQLSQSLPQGWGVMGGLKHVTYNVTTVDVAELTVERYFADYRAALSVYPSHSRTAGSASSYRLQLSRYYGDENNIQILYVNGVEVDKPTGVDSVLAVSVRSLALFGRHWLTREWALTYGLAKTEQGNTTRHAVNFGLRFRF